MEDIAVEAKEIGLVKAGVADCSDEEMAELCADVNFSNEDATKGKKKKKKTKKTKKKSNR